MPGRARYTVLVVCCALTLGIAVLGMPRDRPRWESASLAGTSAITGRWVGWVDNDPGAKVYRVRVDIVRTETGTFRARVDYPGLCSGRWGWRQQADGWWHFSERITEDPDGRTCVPRLPVKVQRADSRLRISWRWNGRDITTMAVRR